MTREPLRSVVVAGGGIIALSAAAAFARALPQTQVTLVETSLSPAALADRLPGARSSIARFHGLIGLDEADLIGAGAATWRIGSRYQHWSADGGDWFDIAGEYGPRAGTVDFHHLWARARRTRAVSPYYAYSAAGALAAAEKFVLPVDDPDSPFSRYDYSLRIKPDRYRGLLARLCDALRVERLRGEIIRVEVDAAGAVAALDLGDGQKVAGDLFIDCTGPDAAILSHVGGAIEDWRSFLPACCVTITDEQGEPAAIDDIQRTAAGWQWHVPGVGSGQVRLAGDKLADSVAVSPGRRRKPWKKNVLAIGDAAVTLDPLGWFGLHLAHQSIDRALSLLPHRDFSAVELSEYNRRTAEDARAIRDLAAAFYQCPAAPAGDFWHQAGALEMPETLAVTVEMFRRRGRLLSVDEDTIGRDSWIATLVGLGVIPQQIDPIANAIDPGIFSAAMSSWASGLADVVQQLPPYLVYLDNTLRRMRDRGASREQ